MELTHERFIAWLRLYGERLQEKRLELSELDQAIGDGDHGINMARGLLEVVRKLDASTPADIGATCQLVAMSLLAKVGGASGPLYSTAFLKMAQVWKGKKRLLPAELAQGFREATEGMKMRGKAQLGDKTMIDVWEPVTRQMEQQANCSWAEVRRQAEDALSRTKELEAKRGRASYLGARSVGHLDPGAASSYHLFDALCQVMEEGGDV
ncbi:dihydroxyacetone kinase subunit DhaL [Laceyella putida]|uniref:Dihydroxyacetone kinase subunit DhaL n=1 Tax=Laceyella putida TaxID=110101 RepID=A0ABW2RQA5_9BACL